MNKLWDLIKEKMGFNMNNEKSYKLQWSRFSPDRSEQYVIRHDDEKEFDLLVAKYKGLLPKAKAFPDDEGDIAVSIAQIQPPAPVCPLHKIPMKYRSGISKAGRAYAFWGCSQKNPDGSWCKQTSKPKIKEGVINTSPNYER